ncbi:voltage-dependent T-type calcium channel subunit alpha-1I [Hoplias malabaricus]|uniref:voltage-dependent T-type calcium channel subunit alpha-1I n=1 Tax=Hoplias malabaricus TaxID=27720 RepID=UPI003461A546
MLLIDNLSGSVFHHYSSPPVCKDCKSHPQEQIHMAELEQASLRSEQLSDKSSSPALPDDLSLDEQSMFQLVVKESMEEQGSGEDAGGCGKEVMRRFSRVHSVGAEDGTQKQLQHLDSSGQHSIDFFHPAAAALQAPPRGQHVHKPRGLKMTSPASWASLRSPGVCKLLSTQYASHSDSSLATGSSEGSLQTTMEEGLSFSVSSPPDPEFPLSLLEPCPNRSTDSLSTETLRPAAFNLQVTRGHHRSQSSSRPGESQQGSSQASNSEQLSETLSSLSLTSLLSPSYLAPPSVKKCNSTGDLGQGSISSRGKERRQLFVVDPRGHLATPWVEGRRGDRKEHSEVLGCERESTSHAQVSQTRKTR